MWDFVLWDVEDLFFPLVSLYRRDVKTFSKFIIFFWLVSLSAYTTPLKNCGYAYADINSHLYTLLKHKCH